MAMSKQDKNNAILSALGHPIRRQILRFMEQDHDGGVSPKVLADELEASIGVVSYHVRLLVQTGVLRLVKTEPRRGAVEHFYTRAGNALDRRASELLTTLGE